MKVLSPDKTERRDYENAPRSKRQKCPECNPVDATGPKECVDCKVIKPRSEFYRSKGRKDGYLDRCKPCQKKYAAGKAKSDVDRLTRKQRRYNQPKKHKAKAMVEQAIIRGDLIRPEKCEECLVVAPLFGHHDDYDRPLVVRWLCSQCHIDWHRMYGEAKNASNDPNDRYIYAGDLVTVLNDAAREGDKDTVLMIAKDLKLGL